LDTPQDLVAENHKTFSNLRQCLDREAPLALVGSGLAMRAGYPSWDGLLQELHSKCGVETSLEPRQALLLHDLKDSLFRAGYYRDLMKREAYDRFLRRTFRPRRGRVHKTIRRFVRLGFSHILTTNYDPTLQRAYGKRPPVPARVVDWCDRERVAGFVTSLAAHSPAERYFLHVHGMWDNPNEIVLTEEDYLDRYVRSEEANRLLFAIFATKRVVFAGFGMEDPDLMQLLRTVAATLHGGGERHFVLMSLDPGSEDAQLIRTRLVKKYGVQPLFYPWTKTHGHLDALIEALAVGDAEKMPDFTRTPDVVERANVRPAPPPARDERRVLDPDDPQRGQWGGKAKAQGRELRAKVRPDGSNWYRVELEVRALSGRPDLAGDVRFHLHDTFPEQDVKADHTGKRVATLGISAYGAFTVGADVENEKTRLELDLATVPGAPAAFRAT